MAHQIRFRRDTASNFTSNNPTLAAGEPGFETDTGKVKVGDGSTAWTSLGYLTGTGSVNSVGSGAGLTGGPITNTGTLDVGAGTGITVNADDIEVDMSAFSTSDLSEGTNLYYTSARANADFDTKLAAADTGDLSEGTNLYYTDGRVDARLSSGSVATITTTGDITTTGFFEGDLNGAVTIDVYNNTASTLSKGDAVYLTGGNNGDNPHVALADNTDAAKMPVVGVIRTNIVAAGVGQVVTSGVMNDSSHGYTLGADLYINSTGGLTTTIPTGESELIQKIGKVVNANQIIVQGAFRTNATPNLDDGNVFLGNASNQTVSATLDTSIVPENTNLYYTDARANTAIGAYTGAISPSNVTLTKFSETVVGSASVSGSVSIDVSTGTIHPVTVTGDITSLALTNAVAGTSATIIVTQDGTGSHTLTAGAAWKWAGGVNTLSTAPADVDIISVIWDGTTYWASLTTEYA